MNQITTCPKCRKEVDQKATKCPHCQSDLRSWVRQHPIGLLIIVLICIPIFGQIIAEPVAPISQEESIFNMKKGAIESFSRSYVKGTLKAPSTAKFNYFPSITENPKKKNSFDVISDVTSQNSFGAMLKSVWSIKVHYIGPDNQESIEEGSNWIMDEFIFDGEKVF